MSSGSRRTGEQLEPEDEEMGSYCAKRRGRMGETLTSGDPLADETNYWTEEAKKAAKSRDLGVMPTLAIPVPVGATGKQALLVLSRGSVVDFRGDVIVNAANTGCLGGGGVDGAISAAGGQALHEARLALPLLDRWGKRCDVGDAKITIGGELPSRWCVHAVGPNYCFVEYTKTAFAECDKQLHSAYVAAMRLCAEKRAKHVGFSLLSAGIFRGRRSLQAVLDIGVLAIAESVYEGLEEVHLVAFTTEEVIALQQAGHTLLENIVAARKAPVSASAGPAGPDAADQEARPAPGLSTATEPVESNAPATGSPPAAADDPALLAHGSAAADTSGPAAGGASGPGPVAHEEDISAAGNAAVVEPSPLVASDHEVAPGGLARVADGSETPGLESGCTTNAKM